MVAMFNLCDQGNETGILLTNIVNCLMYRSTLYLNKKQNKKNPKQTKKTPKKKPKKTPQKTKQKNPIKNQTNHKTL